MQKIRRKRIPKWLTEDDWWFIEEIYELADHRTRLTGKTWCVDHVLPLVGRKVSGLHVPHNLRVILHTENATKSNKYEPN